MDKNEVLSISRKEYQKVDLPEKETAYQAAIISETVGASICVLVSILARILTGTYLISPWIIYFAIIGTNWLVRFIKQKKKSDLIISLVFLAIATAIFVAQIMQFIGVNYGQ